uniref:Methyltransferase like 25B n=1 Tax=Scleropages formosus TaxID=113540 RepID=A0A8C9SU47_SCLFO
MEIAMGSCTFSSQQLRELARDVTSFLSQYKHISDSYIIEFFSEDLWATLPPGWQEALCDLSAPQIANLLLDNNFTERCYPSVWPLSLLAFRTSAHILAFSRRPQDQGAQDAGSLRPEEFHKNNSQSSLLGHIFRKHVKPKKQHEIRKLGALVKTLCDKTCCKTVVDVGSGQGHLTRFLSFGLGLSVTGIEADAALVSMARKFDEQLLSTLKKQIERKVTRSATVPSPNHVIGWVNPRASWEEFIKQLEMGACESKRHTATLMHNKNKELKSASNVDQDLYHMSQTLPSSQSHCFSQHEIVHNVSSDLKVDHDRLITDPQSNSVAFQNCPESKCLDLPSSPKRQRVVERGEAVSQMEFRTEGFILTGLHACGDLSATLLRHFASCPHVLGITSVACCHMKITTKENPTPPGVLVPPCPTHSSRSEFGYPMSSWVRGLPGHQLSYKAREGACHAIEDYVERLRTESGVLKTHCYRAVLETVIRACRPDLRRAGIQTIKKAHLLPFSEYARLGLPRVGLPSDLPLDHSRLDAMLQQKGRVVVYFSLVLLLAPVVETLVLLDRMLFLQERGLQSQLVPLFDPAFSPRNLVLVAVRPGHSGVAQSPTA